jgi:hypothetical protein
MLDVPAGLVENGFERISCIPSIGVACRLLDAIRPELAVADCEFFYRPNDLVESQQQ